MVESGTPKGCMDLELIHGETEEGIRRVPYGQNACCTISVQLNIHLNYFNIE